jgi:hypothetical protein
MISVYGSETKLVVLRFLTRRFGGLEAELMIATCELWWGLSLTLDPLSMEQTRGLSDFFWSGWSSAAVGSVWIMVAIGNIWELFYFFSGVRNVRWFVFGGLFLAHGFGVPCL